MDLSIPIIVSTGILAYIISTKEKRQPTVLRKEIPVNLRPAGKNIFQTDIVRESRHLLQKKADEREKMSKNPKLSGILPRANKNCIETCDSPYSVLPYDVKDTRALVSEQKKQQIISGPMFDDQGFSKEKNSQETFDNISKLAGGKLILEDQENMQPAFRGSGPKNSYPMDTVNRHTGVGLVQHAKTAVENLAIPIKQDVFGSTFRIDQDRVAVSNNKNGILPFPSINTAPLDALAVRFLPKTSDEMYINPRKILDQMASAGAMAYNKVSEIGQFEKNGVDRVNEYEEKYGIKATAIKGKNLDSEFVENPSRKCLLPADIKYDYKYNPVLLKPGLESESVVLGKEVLNVPTYIQNNPRDKVFGRNKEAIFIREQQRSDNNTALPSVVTHKVKKVSENYLENIPQTSKEKTLYNYEPIPEAINKKQMGRDAFLGRTDSKIIFDPGNFEVPEGSKKPNRDIEVDSNENLDLDFESRTFGLKGKTLQRNTETTRELNKIPEYSYSGKSRKAKTVTFEKVRG